MFKYDDKYISDIIEQEFHLLLFEKINKLSLISKYFIHINLQDIFVFIKNFVLLTLCIII